MSNCLPISKEIAATRAAFRAGVKGTRYTENPDPALDIPERGLGHVPAMGRVGCPGQEGRAV